MTDRILSELFPNFVKKEYLQSQRLSLGPFGEGLEKGRTYLKPGQEAPQGAKVQTGSKGGRYYEDTGGGGGGQSPMIPNPGGYEEGTNYTDTQVVNPDIPDTIPNPGGFETGNYTDDQIPNPAKYPSTTGPTANPPEEQVTPELQDSKDYLKTTADAWAEQMTNDPNFTGSEAEIDAAVADLEFEIQTEDSDVRYKHASQGKYEEVHNENSHLDHSEGDIDDDGNWTAPLNEESQKLVDEFRDKISSGGGAAAMETPPSQGGYDSASPPDVSEATFDGQGNIQLPGSDPYPIGEMISDGTDSESLSHLIDAYQNESGGKQSVPGILSEGYSGPLNRDSFEDYISNNQFEDFYITDNDYEDAIGFFDWLGSKAGTDTGAVDEDGFPAGSSPTGEERRAKRDSAFIGGGAQGFNRESGQAPTPDKEYDGYVGARAVEAEKKANEFIEGVGDHLMDQGTGYDPAEISDAIDGYAASRAYLPGSETYDKLQEAGQRFMAERKDESADYYGEDYALMAKMMQKHNINNKRRDPVVLSNKGGRQRK
jgi:hypothetical protein